MVLSKIKQKIKQTFSSDNPLRRGNFVFIHINKTGGTSVARAIGLPKKRHLTTKEVIEIIGVEKWNNAYSFAFVRNPWDKVYSHYKYRCKTNQTKLGEQPIPFKEWVLKTYGPEKDTFYYDLPKFFMPQVDWLLDEKDDLSVSFTGRFEALNDDFETVRAQLGIKNELPKLNATSKGKHYSEAYDQETRDVIGDWFKKDIELWGYSFK